MGAKKRRTGEWAEMGQNGGHAKRTSGWERIGRQVDKGRHVGRLGGQERTGWQKGGGADKWTGADDVGRIAQRIKLSN